jgi:recombination protein RecR
MGKISPLDGIGPDDIALDGLEHTVKNNVVKEVIVALSPTIEGQTTIHFIQARLHPYAVSISQLAHGIPMGGELEFLDANTIGSALRNRGRLEQATC